MPSETKVLERAGMLLAIDRALKHQFDEQPLMQQRWISSPNIWLKGRAPIEKMLEGFEGIRDVYELFEHHSLGEAE